MAGAASFDASSRCAARQIKSPVLGEQMNHSGRAVAVDPLGHVASIAPHFEEFICSLLMLICTLDAV